VDNAPTGPVASHLVSYQAAALLASTAWAFGGLISAKPSRVLGGARFTRARMGLVTVILALGGWLAGGWSTVERSDLWPLILSGLIGLGIGDVALFEAFARLGPRRTGMLFTTTAPMAALLSAIFLGERFSAQVIIGSLLVLVGIVFAIAFGTKPGQSHTWEDVKGDFRVGILFGLLGALGQAVGLVIADPVFDGTLDVWAGGAVRAIAGTIGLWLLVPILLHRRPQTGTLDARLWRLLVISAIVGMVVGKTSLLYALTEGDPGVVSVLAGVAPVIQLPLIWVVTRRAPAIGAWVGAVIAVAGTALIVL